MYKFMSVRKEIEIKDSDKDSDQGPERETTEGSKPSKLILLIPFLIFFSVVLMMWVSLGEEKSDDLPSARLGDPMPAFSLTSLQDDEIMLTEQSLKGPLLLNVLGDLVPGLLH